MTAAAPISMTIPSFPFAFGRPTRQHKSPYIPVGVQQILPQDIISLLKPRSIDESIHLIPRKNPYRCVVCLARLVVAVPDAEAAGAPEAIQHSPIGDTGLRNGGSIFSQATSFLAPSHSPVVFPITTHDSSEFLPSPSHYSPSYHKSLSSDPTYAAYSSSRHPEAVSSLSFSKPFDVSHFAIKRPPKTALYDDDGRAQGSPSHLSGPTQSPNAYRGHQHFENPESSVSPSSSSSLDSTSALRSGREEKPSKRPLEVSSVRFQCKGRTGYYGDEDFDCKVFHYCSHDGKRFTFRCGSGLTFNEATVSCGGESRKRCSPAIISGTDYSNLTRSTSPPLSSNSVLYHENDVDDPSPPRYRTSVVATNGKNSESGLKSLKSNTPQTRPNAGADALPAWASLANGQPKSPSASSKTIDDGSRSNNPFFDHFTSKMKDRVKGTPANYQKNKNLEDQSPVYEYEYEYDYEYDEEPYSTKTKASLQPAKNSSAGVYTTTKTEISSEYSKDYTRPNRDANHLRGPPPHLSSVNPTGFQSFSPTAPFHRPNFGPTERPIISVTPGPVFITTNTPVYDRRPIVYHNHPPVPSHAPPPPRYRVILPTPLSNPVHQQPHNIHPIPSHLTGSLDNRIRPRPTQSSLTSHPQFLAHVNSLTGGRVVFHSHPNSPDSSQRISSQHSLENRQRQNSHEIHPFVGHGPHDTRSFYSSNKDRDHLIASVGTQGSNIFLSTPHSHEINHPLSPVRYYSSSLETNNPYSTSSSFPVSHESSRPITKSSTFPNSYISRQPAASYPISYNPPYSTPVAPQNYHESRRPVSNFFPTSNEYVRPESSSSSFPNSYDPRQPTGQSSQFGTPDSRWPVQKPQGRPRPTHLPTNTGFLSPDVGGPSSNRPPVITSTSRPFGIPNDPSNHFLSGHPLDDRDRRPISSSDFDSRIPGDRPNIEDPFQRPAIRFPNRGTPSDDERYRPISSTTPQTLTGFQTTTPATTFPRSPLHTSPSSPSPRPSSNRRPASHKLRQRIKQDSRDDHSLISDDRRTSIPNTFPDRRPQTNEIRPELHNSFHSSTPNSVHSQTISSNGFSTTLRSPLHDDDTEDPSEYEYYDDPSEYYDDYNESKPPSEKPVKINSKPIKQFDYYDEESSSESNAPSPPKKPTRHPSFSTITESNIKHSFHDRPTERPVTTTEPTITTRRSILNKKPSLANRFPPRLRSRTRTTTESPGQDSRNQVIVSTEGSIRETSITVGPNSVISTERPQLSIRNRFKFRNRSKSTATPSAVSTSTEEPFHEHEEENIAEPVITTRRPRPSPSGRLSSQDRLAALKNRLNIRNKRVKTEKQNSESTSEDNSTHNKSLQNESIEIEKSESRVPAKVTHVSEQGQDENHENPAEFEEGTQNDSNAYEDEGDQNPSGPLGGAFRKRPLDPEVRARFRKFLKNRRKKLGSKEGDNEGAKGKSLFGASTSLPEENADPEQESSSQNYSQHGSENEKVRYDLHHSENDKVRQEPHNSENDKFRHEPPTEITRMNSRRGFSSRGRPDASRQYIEHDEKDLSSREEYNSPKKSSDSNSLVTESSSQEQRLSFSTFSSEGLTTIPSYKHQDVIAISEEDSTLQNDSPVSLDDGEIYENLESQTITSKKAIGNSARFETSTQTPNVDQFSTEKTTLLPIPNRRGNRRITDASQNPNFSLSKAVSKTTFIATSTPTTFERRTTSPVAKQIKELSTPEKNHSDEDPMQSSTKHQSEDVTSPSLELLDHHTSTPSSASPPRFASNFEISATPFKANSQPKMPHRVAKPVFNFDRKFSNPSERDHFISASDYNGNPEDISPVSLVPFTMSTDPPLLPLQKLLPLRK